MEEPLPRLKPEVQAGVANYVVRLGELLAQCAREADRDVESFLWHSRRVLEVICHILYSIHEDQLSQDDRAAGDLDSRLKGLRKAGVPPEVSIALDNIRQNCNLGVHVRGPEPETYPLALKHVRTKLPDIIDWLFNGSAASHYVDRPDKLDEVLREIRGELVDSRVVVEPPRPSKVRRAPTSRAKMGWVVAAVLMLFGIVAWWAWGQGGSARGSVASIAGPVVASGSKPTAKTGAICPTGMIRTGGSFCIDPGPRTWTQFAGWLLSPEVIVDACSWRDGERGAPVVCVSRDEAAAYCQSFGGDLPDQMQWIAILREPAWGARPSEVREWLRDVQPTDPPVGEVPGEVHPVFGFATRAKATLEEGAEAPWDPLVARERARDLGFRCAADPT